MPIKQPNLEKLPYTSRIAKVKKSKSCETLKNFQYLVFQNRVCKIIDSQKVGLKKLKNVSRFLPKNIPQLLLKNVLQSSLKNFTRSLLKKFLRSLLRNVPCNCLVADYCRYKIFELSWC